MPHGRGYGCIPDDFDARDRRFGVGEGVPDDLVITLEHDLTPWFIKPVMDQGGYGTCTCHGAPAAWRYDRINNDLPDIPLSAAQLYEDAGLLEGDTSDVGRQIRDVVKCMATTGVARESLWPYDKVLQGRPPAEVYVDALNQRISGYQRVVGDTPDKFRRALNVAIYTGHPVIIGIPIFKQFESDEAASTGIIRMPEAGETEVGWHCMLHGAYGARDRLLNSWADWWGLPEQKGYCAFDNEYLPKFAQDCWQIFIDKGASNATS